MTTGKTFSTKYYIFLILFLGLLSAFGPFITDMYLPTMPSMAEIFRTTTSKVQLGLTTSLIGLAIGQIFFGPLSDKYGRKKIIIGSLIIFSISSIGSIYAHGIDFFNTCRFFQGLGGAGGVVVSRSVTTDCYSGRELAKTMAIIAGINNVTPVIAPVAGGFIAAAMGWQGIFWVLFGIGIVLLGMSYPFEESLNPENRHHGKLADLFKAFPELLRIKPFKNLVIIYILSYGILFAYIASSSFIVQSYYGYSELWFSMIFAINAVGMGVGSALILRFKDLINAPVVGNMGILIVSLLQLIFFWLFDTLLCYEGLTFIMAVLLGVVFTSTTTMAMESGRKFIGAASATLGTSGYLFGGIVSPLVGIGNILLTTILILLVCSLLSSFFSIRFKKKQMSSTSEKFNNI